VSTSDSRTGTGQTAPAESTSKLPAFDSASSPSEQGLGAGKGSAARGASRSPKKSGSVVSGAEKERRGPRRVRLTLARLDPFSVMKLSFLIAIAVGIATS
jgi:hypothetical protein